MLRLLLARYHRSHGSWKWGLCRSVFLQALPTPATTNNHRLDRLQSPFIVNGRRLKTPNDFHSNCFQFLAPISDQDRATIRWCIVDFVARTQPLVFLPSKTIGDSIFDAPKHLLCTFNAVMPCCDAYQCLRYSLFVSTRKDI